jgi:hypothetical protein
MGFLDKLKRGITGSKEKADDSSLHSSDEKADDKEFRLGDESVRSSGDPSGPPPPPPL